MEENIYSNYLNVFKNKKSEKFGICGWIPQFCNFYKVNLKDKSYEDKLFYCHLSDDEKILNLHQKKRNLTFYRYFLKKNIFMIINITFQRMILFHLKENI